MTVGAVLLAHALRLRRSVFTGVYASYCSVVVVCGVARRSVQTHRAGTGCRDKVRSRNVRNAELQMKSCIIQVKGEKTGKNEKSETYHTCDDEEKVRGHVKLSFWGNS